MKTNQNKTPPLSPATLHILLALAGGDLHGYGILQEIARHSAGHYKLGHGTLYDNLKKLMDTGLVADLPATEADDRRLYTLTLAGRGTLSAETERLDRVVQEARLRLRLHGNETRHA